MTLLNSSLGVSEAATPTHQVGTHLIGTNEVQGYLPVAPSGHVEHTEPTYNWWVPSSVVGANKLYGDLFNAAGSGKIIEVRGVWAIPKSDVGVTGVLAVGIGLYRTSAVGTGGTAHTYNGGTANTSHVIVPWDTNDAAPPAQITARAAPTAGATISAFYWEQYLFTEETNAATYFGPFINLIPVSTRTKPITLREGQGLLIKQGTVLSAGNMSFLVLFTLV